MKRDRHVGLWSVCLLLLTCPTTSPARSEELIIPKQLLQQCNKKLGTGNASADETAACNDIIKLSQKIHAAPTAKAAPGISSAALVDTQDRSQPAHGTPGPGPEPVDQRLFVRSDRIDNLFYGVLPGYSSGQAQGASINYSDNRNSRSSTGAVTPMNTLMLSGTVSYVMPPTPWDFDAARLQTFAAAVWVYGNGTWDHPIKPFSDASVAKAGLDFQYAQKFQSGFFDDILFDVAPYFETNFEGDAQGFGTSFTLEPVISSLYLGQSSGGNALFNGFWILRPEADVVQINKLPFTNLAPGTYEWLGATLRAYVFLFPSANFPWSPALADRVSLTGTMEYFRDANTGMEAKYYSAQLAYNLNGCTTADTGIAKCPQGTSSLSFEYDYGTDRDTMIKANKYLVKLNYKH
jgi:hypothetical protein